MVVDKLIHSAAVNLSGLAGKVERLGLSLALFVIVDGLGYMITRKSTEN